MVQISISESRKLVKLKNLKIKLEEKKKSRNTFILVAFKFPFALFSGN